MKDNPVSPKVPKALLMLAEAIEGLLAKFQVQPRVIGRPDLNSAGLLNDLFATIRRIYSNAMPT